MISTKVVFLIFGIVSTSLGCEDDVTYRYNDKKRDCVWVSKNIEKRCKKENFQGQKAKHFCIRTCGKCDGTEDSSPEILNKSVPIGGKCQKNVHCLHGFCSSDGTCSWKKKDGESCSGDFACKSKLCVENICTTETSSTGTDNRAPKIPDKSVKVGEKCEQHANCVYGFCSSSSGKCTWKRNVGQPCPEDFACRSGSCVAGKCSVSSKLSIGQTCSKNIDCASNYCKQSKCTARQGNGGNCYINKDCQSRRCSGGVCLSKNAQLKENGQGCTTWNECKSEKCRNGICVDKAVVVKKAALGEGCIVDSGCISMYCFNWKCAERKILKEEGQVCNSDDDCVSQYCSGQICRAKTALKELGQSCSNNSECKSQNCKHRICIQSAQTETKLSIGASCTGHNKCQSNYCSNGVCATKKANGMACGGHNQCQSNYCANGTCSTQPRQNGQSCSNDSQCVSKFCSDQVCKPALKELGESCSEGTQCKSLSCNNWKCAEAELGIGKPCNGHNKCQSNYCSNGFCALKPPVASVPKSTGESCSSNIECVSGKCSLGTCLAHDECEVLGGYQGPFDQDTIVLVFVGSGFDDMNKWDIAALDYFNSLKNVEMFSDERSRYKALYVRELNQGFCNYWCKDIERLLCCEQDIAKSYTDKCFPKTRTMQTVIIHNDEKYGGAGYIEEVRTTKYYY